MCHVAKQHLSMRIDGDVVAAVDAMADQRDVDRTTMVDKMLRAALSGKQRACRVSHREGVRCGECGLLIESGVTYENL